MKFAEKYPMVEKALIGAGSTIKELDDCRERVLAAFDELADPIPDGPNAGWKVNKPAQARKAVEEVSGLANLLGFSPLLVSYFSLGYAAHELGRMTQTYFRNNVPVTGELAEIYPSLVPALRESVGYDPYDDRDERHGYESAIILKPILGDLSNTHSGEWLLTAMVQHSFIVNPTLEECRDESQFAVTGCIRDLSKVAALNGEVRDYTENPARKELENQRNFKGQCPERGCILPESWVFDLPLTTPVNRQLSGSYEAYMLQFIKWTFGFMIEELQDAAIAVGGPKILAQYLLRQLEATPDQRAKLLEMLQEWRGGILLS